MFSAEILIHVYKRKNTAARTQQYTNTHVIKPRGKALYGVHLSLQRVVSKYFVHKLILYRETGLTFAKNI